MKRIAILIATTGGPVLVDRITPEPAPQSMVCLRRQSEVLPISPDYDDFVRAGSGVIMREFGPYEEGAFRLDVSAPITTGRSWQLGFYAAHAVFKSKTCVLSDLQSADLVVWLSGTVDNDLNVGDVDHMAQKVEASALMLVDCVARGVPVVLAAGDKNATFLKDHAPPKGVQVASLKTVRELDTIIGIAKKSSDKNAVGFWAMAGAVLVAFGGLFLFANGGEEAALEIDVYSDRGQNPSYKFGEDLSLIVKTSHAAWVVCEYKQVDGQVIQIYPNEQTPDVQKLLPDQEHVLAGGESAAFRIQLGPPAGSETVTCYAHESEQSANALKEKGIADHMRVTLTP